MSSKGKGKKDGMSKQSKAFYQKYFMELMQLFPTMNDFLQLPKLMHLRKYYQNDISPAHIRKQKKFFKGYKKKFKEKFPKRERGYVDKVFEFDINTTVEGFKFPLELMPINHMLNPIVDYVEIINGSGAVYEIKTQAEYKDAMHKTKEFAVWCKQAVKNMKRGVKKGYVLPTIIAKSTISDIRGVIEGKSYVNSNIKQDLPKPMQKEWNKVIRKYFVSPSKKVLKYMEKDYLKKTRKTLGYKDLPNGKELYEYMVKINTTLPVKMLPVKRIHEIGLREVKKVKAEMEKVRKKVGFKGNLKKFFKYIKDSKELHYKDTEAGKEQVLTDYHKMQDHINKIIMPEYFDVKMSHDYQIKAVPEFKQDSAPAAYYMPGDLTGKRKGTFYLNMRSVNQLSKIDVEVLSLHEGNPGHHYQSTTTNDNPNIPLFIKAGGYGSYIEGWGLYSEDFGTYDGNPPGITSGPLSYFGKLNFEMMRSIRLVVDTGLHMYGWSVDKATKYFVDNSALPRIEIDAEVLRYVADPGQALGYKIGDLSFEKMGEKWKKKGKLMQYHRILMENGPGPLSVVIKYMNKVKV